jgi:uncharacterized RDD family membrane protein YckC
MNSNQDIFASLATRIKASIIDSIILMALFISIPMVIGAFSNSESTIKAVVMFAPLLLLEPFLVAYLGSTIGQFVFGIKIVRVDSRSNCPLFASFFRYLAKTVLGGVSLIYMLFSRKHQAIHDHLAGTIVLISRKKLEKNPALAKYGEAEQTLSREYIYPSSFRRFILFVVWYIFSANIIGTVTEIVATMAISGHAGRLPDFVDMLLSIVLAVVFIALAVLAAKGYLPGARRKKRLSTMK